MPNLYLFPLSDLHLGKSLYNYSLIEDQDYILDQITGILVEKKVEVLIIAGDVYDKNVAPEAGLKVLRKFLNRLVEAEIKVLIISGNHDSAIRFSDHGALIETGSHAELMKKQGHYFRLYTRQYEDEATSSILA